MNDSRNQGGGSNREGGGGGRGGRGRRGRNNRGGKRGGSGGGQDQQKQKAGSENNSQPHSNPRPNQHAQPDSGDKKKGGRNRRRRGRRGGGNGGADSLAPKKPMGRVIEHIEPVTHGVLFFDTHAQAKNNLSQIIEKSKEVAVLNVVIKSEGTMNDPEILEHARMFAGEAWYLIHTRRQEDGWYDAPRPKPAGILEAQPEVAGV